MATRIHKDYHDEEYDPTAFFQTYIGHQNKGFREIFLEYPLKLVSSTVSSGVLNGNVLLDLTVAPTFCHLMLLADTFKEIIMLESSDVSLQEVEKWLRKEPGAVDWSDAAKIISLNKNGSEQWEDIEEKVRRAVKQVLKCDFTQDNPVDPVVLPPLDCIFTFLYLESISKDHDQFISNLRKLTTPLKVGGYLLIGVPLNLSYYMIDHHKFFVLAFDEEFIQMALRDCGLTIVNSHQYEHKQYSHLFDNKHMLYIVACKEK